MMTRFLADQRRYLVQPHASMESSGDEADSAEKGPDTRG